MTATRPGSAAGGGPDDVVQQLRDRVAEVTAAQGRLTALLDAVVGLGSDLDLTRVLDRIIVSACRLVDARYGALGVLGPDGLLKQFVAHGIDDATRARIGPPPQGHGILGLLIEDPRPLRLADLRAHPRSYGFPANHPPMAAFLGVPIRTHGQLFGHLYLTEKLGGGEFTEHDEEVLVALASAAGVALENARLYAQSAQRQRWLEALSEIQEVLLGSTDRTSALRLIAARAQQVADADFAGILLPDEGGAAVEVVAGGAAGAVGAGSGARFPLEGSLTGEVLRSGRAVVVDDLVKDERAFVDATGWPVGGPDLGAALFVPLSSSSGTLGVLVVARVREHRAGFALTEAQLVGSLAGQAALALERLRARDDRARLAVFEDRDRIARDLHDLVIQRLFATGLQLQGAARSVGDDPLRGRLDRAVDDLDATIAAIRGSIFQLHSRPEALAAEVRGLVAEFGRTLGRDPVLTVDGPLESGVPERVRPHLVAVLREALTNVARHAGASRVGVRVEVGDRIAVVVEDDGVGFGPTTRRSGLRNLGERAAGLGGTLALAPVGPDGGTRLTWQVPLRG